MTLRAVLLLVMSATLIVRPATADQLPVVKPEAVGLSSARLERLAQVIRRDVETGRMPGAVVAIARKGKLAYYEAFGFADAAARTPMAKDAIFSLASMTKPMAAVATLMLVEQGDLLLNDPVGNYLPALKDMKVATPDRRGAGPPSAHAAGHAAAHRRGQLRQPRRLAAAQALRRGGEERRHAVEHRVPAALRSLPLFYEPGTQWEYSYGLDVAAPGRRSRDQEAAGRVPAGTAVHAAGHGRHRLRRARRPRRRGSPGRCRPIPTPASRSPSACR